MAQHIKTERFNFSVGDKVKVYQLIKEDDKERTQIFEGIVIAIKKKKPATFTVRKIGAQKVGVERIWPIDSPWIKKIEVVEKGRVRRAKLYYTRKKQGKKRKKVKKG